jgi:hypothetical protein
MTYNSKTHTFLYLKVSLAMPFALFLSCKYQRPINTPKHQEQRRRRHPYLPT